MHVRVVREQHHPNCLNPHCLAKFTIRGAERTGPQIFPKLADQVTLVSLKHTNLREGALTKTEARDHEATFSPITYGQ